MLPAEPAAALGAGVVLAVPFQEVLPEDLYLLLGSHSVSVLFSSSLPMPKASLVSSMVSWIRTAPKKRIPPPTMMAYRIQ